MYFRAEPNSAVVGQFVGFGRYLRDHGIAVSPASMVEFFRALEHINLAVRPDVKAAARATLINKREDLQAFDLIFDQFWAASDVPPNSSTDESESSEQGGSQPPEAEKPRSLLLAGETPADEPQDNSRHETTGYSDRDIISQKDLGALDAGEILRARELIAELVKTLANKPGRRFQAAPRGSVVDFRRSFRNNLQSGFSGIVLKYRRPSIGKTRLILLCDISGSMERYSRFLLDFIFALRQQLPALEAAVFATHMTPITPHLKQRDLQKSLAQLSAQARGWGGGTDIGRSLAQFNQHYGRDMSRSRTTVVILSDGWDRGDADVMRRQIADLRRRVCRLIWLNPLLGGADYQPLCQGIKTALPHLDHFLPAHNLASLADVAKILRQA